jgi:pimeloyl-ACP methyl ester carboxylesterase
MTQTTATNRSSEQTGEKNAIRPFHVNIPETALVDLRQRLAQTRLPDKETVTDYSQGVPLKTVQQLLRHWQTHYDWRKCEARINAVPNFITEIDGLDIHFIHARSKHENALPIIVTHGWPGSIVEQLKIIEPLTNPTAHGGTASDAFHVVIPSMPGYGFSGKPTGTGWGPGRIARAWTTLMRRLGYKQFVAQGGDWGATVTEQIGVQAPPELLGIHTNMPGAIPAEIDQSSFAGAPVPSGLSAEREARTNSSFSSTSMFTTPSGWQRARKQGPRLLTRPSASRRSCLTTTCAVWSSSRVRSTVRPKASRRTMSSTMSSCSG